MKPKVDVTDLSYLLDAVDESMTLDEQAKFEMRTMIHNFSNQHSTLAIQQAKDNKNPILKILDRLIPPASERQGGTFNWEEENVTPTFASKPKAKKAVRKSTPKKKKPRPPIDDVFGDIDDEILGFDD